MTGQRRKKTKKEGTPGSHPQVFISARGGGPPHLLRRPHRLVLIRKTYGNGEPSYSPDQPLPRLLPFPQNRQNTVQTLEWRARFRQSCHEVTVELPTNKLRALILAFIWPWVRDWAAKTGRVLGPHYQIRLQLPHLRAFCLAVYFTSPAWAPLSHRLQSSSLLPSKLSHSTSATAVQAMHTPGHFYWLFCQACVNLFLDSSSGWMMWGGGTCGSVT